MPRHDDVVIDPQALLVMAEVEAFRDDLAGRCRDKYRQPVRHAEGDVEQSPVGMEAVAFHEGHPMRPAAGQETCGRAERRSGGAAGQETAASVEEICGR